MPLAGSGPAHTRRSTLTVLSWNLHEGIDASSGAFAHGAGPANPRATEEVVAMIAERNVDVAAFQEVGFDRHGHAELLAELRRRTPLRHVAAHPLHASSFTPGRRSGVAVASRFPLRKTGRYVLPNPGLRVVLDGQEIHSHDKGHVRVTVGLGESEVDVTSLHSFPFYLFRRDAAEPEFKEIWRALADQLERPGGPRRLLVCGDFNANASELLLDTLDVPLVSTFDGRPTHRGRSVDDVLHSPDLVLTESVTVDNYSDHLACVAVFQLPCKEASSGSGRP
ncbi:MULTISPECIES: endonuclease/exonuclease/phosphatase family protein [Streptomyces]|uniref:endonuclease/exonuclease/phosphatase family protein n=1 Tax=Streptomyces sp. SYP-A7185 TaxID=3040076 RepID=UPI0038F75646